MLKKILFVVLAVAFVGSVAAPAWAQSISMSATITGPTGIDPTILQVVPDPNDPEAWLSSTEVTTMNFGQLTLRTFPNPNPPPDTFSIFLPAHYYAIDVGFTFGGGAEINGIRVAYTDGSPTGLGFKGNIALVRKTLVGGVEKPEELADRIRKDLMIRYQTSPSNINLISLAGGWLRVYAGINTKDPALGSGDIENSDPEAQVFAPGDVGGAYTGTLVLSTF